MCAHTVYNAHVSTWKLQAINGDVKICQNFTLFPYIDDKTLSGIGVDIDENLGGSFPSMNEGGQSGKS